jgi:hypothetical protein
MRATPSSRTHESVSTAAGPALQITSPRAAGVGDVRVERTAETTWATRCRCAGQRADICAAAAAQKTCALTVARCLNDLSCPVQRYSVVRPAARGLGWAGSDPDGRLPTAARQPPVSSSGLSRRPTMPRVRPAATGTGARLTQVHDGDASVSVTAEPPSHPITSNPKSRSATLPRLGKLTRAARLQDPPGIDFDAVEVSADRRRSYAHWRRRRFHDADLWRHRTVRRDTESVAQRRKSSPRGLHSPCAI